LVPAGAPSSYTNKTLTWGANATAAFTLNYTDVGQLRLYARYAVPPAATLMTGSSAAFVVRPFGFTIANVRRTSDSFANPAAADATGTGFIGAGRSFTLSVTAVNQTGNPTPNYGKETAPEGVLLTPALVAGLGLTAIPALGNNVVAGAEFGAGGAVADANGTATVTNVNWGEAGIITITPSVGDGDYLGAGDVTGTTTGNVGRFFPDHYALTGVPALTNRSALLCAPASTFTYMGEGMVLAFSLQAQNAANAVTQNYRTSGTASQNFAKLDLGALASLNSGARSGATNLTPRIDATGGTSAGTWSNGAANVTATTGIRRATPDAPDGPYAATAFGIAPADVDGVAMNTLDLDVDNNSVNDHKALGVATEFRFGRLRLLNAYGSCATVLPVPIEVQYWNGTSFALNSADSCTSLPRSAIALGFTAPLVACNTAVSSATVAFAAGVGSLVLSAPGAGNSGSVLLTPNLGTAAGSYCNPGSFVAATASPANYLLGRWDDAANPDTDGNTAYDDKPGARAAFGVYGSQPRNFIFFRENY
jgi:MSHA biogenesis protein MshQ